MKYKRHNGDIFIKISLAILFLLTITLGINKDLYAKFVSKDSADDSARVAKFDIEYDDENFFKNFNMTYKQNGDNTSETRTLVITNASEVVVSTKITIQTSGNLPLMFELKEVVEDVDVVGVPDDDIPLTLTPIETNDGTRKAESQSFELDIDESITLSLRIYLHTPVDAKYSGFVDLINIKTTTVQVD